MLLELKNIVSGYGKVSVLKKVSLQVKEGEIITLIGGNGAGKSTTLMTISGILGCWSGEIYFDGRRINGLGPDRIVKLGISQVPEGRRIFSALTVQENLDMGAFLRKDSMEIKNDLDYVFSLFPILHERRHQYGGTLSGGEQQMLAMSRALLARPRLLLLDEPSMGLAPIIIQKIFAIIQKINKDHNTTLFLVEQNAHQALRIADRGYVLENGRITLSDSAEKLMVNDEVKRAYLGL